MALTRSIGAALNDDNTGTEPIDVRKGLAGLFTNPGVLPGGAAPLVTGSAGWAYTVKAAKWVTSRGASDGVHLWGNDGDITVGSSGVGGTVTAAPGGALTRIDIIYALHPSNGENSDTTSEPTVAVAVGTPGSPGLAPSIPVGALELARNTMTSSATTTASSGNTITQSAAVAYLVGTEPVTPEGGVGRRTSSLGSITTTDVVLATAPAVTGDGVKRFKITATCTDLESTVANDIFRLKIKDGATQLQSAAVTMDNGASFQAAGGILVVTNVPSAGSHTYTLTAARVSGSGTGVAVASASVPIEIIVERIS